MVPKASELDAKEILILNLEISVSLNFFSKFLLFYFL